MQSAIHAKKALLPSGWASDVRIEITDGKVTSTSASAPAQPGDAGCEVLLPTMPNLHSHAFQRAMAGLAEVRGPGEDSFWSWRTQMYRFALSMSPDQVEAVAAQLYMEMLEAGYGRVGEFHYLHHDKDGGHYANISEMAERIASASAETGIALTLLPVFYAHSGFGGAVPGEGQRRFIHDINAFSRQIDACATLVRRLENGHLGIAPHSLRAVTPDELNALLPLAEAGPIHIHVAEQVREVEDCKASLGARPVEWLLDHMPVDNRWCLIHATHMLETETRGMAERGAVAGLCPITEANLGDGIFDGVRFRSAGGKWGVGSDSNVLISVAQELRQLEYSQRLGLRSRNALADPGCSTGRALFQDALIGGGQALQVVSTIEVGNAADFVSLDVSAVPYLSEDQILDSWIFAGNVAIDCVWTSGRKMVEHGRHIHRDRIETRFRQAMQELMSQ